MQVGGQKRRKSSRAKPRAELRGNDRAEKISVTVDRSVLREARRCARSEGQSLSAHVTEALARDLRRRRLTKLIDDYEADHGAISEKKMAEIRREWVD